MALALPSESVQASEWVSNSLDLLSTSQKLTRNSKPDGVSQELWHEAIAAYEERQLEATARCENGAPFIFYVSSDRMGHVVSGCCNSWLCNRCGHLRAAMEYGRMVEGCRKCEAASIPLYFITFTCRGRELSVDDAEQGYLQWSNRLLSACRYRASKQGCNWLYVQVTERQRRGHPHSHLITSFCPDDAIPEKRRKRRKDGSYETRNVLHSSWFLERVQSSGLGRECEITSVRSSVAVAVYVAKYLFKDAMTTEWAKGWKRIRYSQSFPKLERQAAEVAFPLVNHHDWLMLRAYIDSTGIKLVADDQNALEKTEGRGIAIRPKKQYNGQGNASY